ncbi:hypothetical protein ACA910_012965 [Epithemia clementina (nom. ined.)]
MLRPIPEDKSDHAALDAASSEPLSAAGAVASEDDVAVRSNSNSNVSDVSAVLADPQGGARRGMDSSGDIDGGLVKKEQSRESRKERRRQLRQRRRKRRFKRWASWRSFVVMGIVVVAAVVIVVSIVTTTKGSSSSNNGNDILAESRPPTPSPTLDPQTLATLDKLINDIVVPSARNTSYEASILQIAHERAHQWIVSRDLLRDEVLADSTPIRFTQRYVLALLFYSMQFNNNQISKELEDKILSSDLSECGWEGVFCDEEIVEQTSTTTVLVPVVRRIEWGAVGAVGVLPPELRSLKYLQELNVSINKLQGTIPLDWFENRSVSSSSSEPLIEQLYHLPYLYMFDCRFNNLGGPVPAHFWTLPSLRFVYLANNSLTGMLPPDDFMVNSTRASFLQDVWIDHNEFTGTLPGWIFTLPILKSFSAEHNDLTGSLDGSVTKGQLPKNMETLDLSFNNFTGQIPEAFFTGVSLTFLYLDHNNFTKLPNISSDGPFALTDIWMENNSLQGPIPQNFGVGWPNLRELKLEGNQLTGEIRPGCDEEVTADGAAVLWPGLSLMQADCKRSSAAVDAPVTCECCTSCF